MERISDGQNRSAHQKFVSSLFLAIYIYTVHFGAHQFCRQNGRTVLPPELQNRSAHQKFVPSPFLVIYIYIRCTLGPISSAGRTAEPFCRQNDRTVLPAERQNRSAGRTTEPFCRQNDRTV